MKLTWIGHSCFKLEENGYAIVTDPYGPGKGPGLKDVDEKAQLVLCSHEHGDHGYREAVEIIESDAEMPEITGIASWHDDEEGAKRGENTIMIIDWPEERAVHLGDIGCDLSDEEKDALRGADALMIPIGGFYTISPERAAQLVRELQPGIVIPMHYRDESLHFGYETIAEADAFLKEMEDYVIVRAGSCIDTAEYLADDETKIIVMTPQNTQ